MNPAVSTLDTWLQWFEPTVLGYFLSLNTIYLMLTIAASIAFFHHLRRVPFAGHGDVFANPLTPGVSIIVPAHNEQAGIINSVRAMLSLRFPQFEIIVVDDGSSDDTYALLEQEFCLVEVPMRTTGNLHFTGEMKSLAIARDGEPLLVVRKENGGSKAHALNAGINVSQYPLVCMIDADSLLDPNALLRVVKPFVDDPQHVVATGGVVRPANGCSVDRGEVTSVHMPKSWLARVQVVEYLRSFLLGRTGWSSLHSLLIISGAFGMFRRDMVLEVGGLDAGTMGEDAELVAKLHRHMRDNGRTEYKMVFVSEPVCWTEVPTTMTVLARQRRRWSRGLAEVLWRHKSMMFNPKYGRIGMIVFPYFLIFELLGPIVELLGIATLVAIGALWITGETFGFDTWIINTEFAVLLAIVSFGYGFFLSLAAVTVEEFSYRRMRSWRDLGISFVASLIENVGYRQLHSLWRLQGLIWWASKRNAKWGVMTRAGFDGPKNLRGPEEATLRELEVPK